VAVDWTIPSTSTNCSISLDLTLTQTTGEAKGSTLGDGTYYIAYTAMDDCNQTASCGFTIVVNKGNNSGGLCLAKEGFRFLGEFESNGYYLSHNKMTWSDAKVDAIEKGGYLASISSEKENEFIRSNLNNSLAFIGINDATVEGKLEWSNSELMTFNKSYNNYDGNDFGVINFWKGTWEMNNQWVHKKYILEKTCAVPVALTITCQDDFSIAAPDGAIAVSWDLPTAMTSCASNDSISIHQISGITMGTIVTPGNYTISYAIEDMCGEKDTCTFVITVVSSNNHDCGDVDGDVKLGMFNNHGYYLSNMSMNWEAAKIQALQDGGYLASITSAEENEFIRSNIKGNMVLIGLNDAQMEGSLQWANGESFGFDLSSNNYAARDYAVMNFWDVKWELNSYWVSKRYVMEIDCAVHSNSGHQPKPMVIFDASPIVTISPNPVQDKLFVTMSNVSPGKLDLEILSLAGESVLTKSIYLDGGRVHFDIDVLGRNNGIFFLKLISDEYQETVKFVH